MTSGRKKQVGGVHRFENRPRSVSGLARIGLALVASAAALLSPALAWAQPAHELTPFIEQPKGPAIPTRADTAQAYLRFESTLFRNPIKPERLAEINADFDRLTQSYFSQRPGEAIRTILDTEWKLRSNEPMPAELALVNSLRVRAFPRLWSFTTPTPLPGPILVLESLYEVADQPARQTTVQVQVRRAGASGVALVRDVACTLGAGAFVRAMIPLGEEFRTLGGGTFEITLECENSGPVTAELLTSVPGAFDDALRQVREGIQLIEGFDSPNMARPLQIIKARAELISDTPSPERTAAFLLNPVGLAGEILQDLRRMDEHATNPYENRQGEYWRPLPPRADGSAIPMRVQCPMSAASGKPMPLVIALHGAGGDESMFMLGYGSGAIRRLSEERGFLVATPYTPTFGSDASHFDALLADLSRDYNIDRNRVYVLGHSLGAIAAAGLATARSDQIAAIACIAGYRDSKPGARPVPTLVVSGAQDPIFTPERLNPLIENARAAGVPIEAREVPNQGHTLLVGTELPEVMTWLLNRSLEQPAAR